MPTGQKSHLHPSALTINGLNPGRIILQFNRYSGTRRTFVVLERPVVRSVILAPNPLDEVLFVIVIPPSATVVHTNIQVVKLRDVETGRDRYDYLNDLGVVPYQGGRFNDTNFVVDHRKKHLLPTTRVPYPAHRARLSHEEDFFGDERYLEF